jgi:hypothetical protein
VLKTGSPILTMAALALTGLERPTEQLACAVLLVAAGTALASYGEVAFSWPGFGAMVGSQLCDAVRLVLTQLLLGDLGFAPLEGLRWLAPPCAFCLCVGTVALELHGLLRDAPALDAASTRLFALSALLGFATNASSMLVIQSAGALSLKLLGAATNALLGLAAGRLFNERTLSAAQLGGYAISLVGFAAYYGLKLSGGGGGAGAAAPRWGGERVAADAGAARARAHPPDAAGGYAQLDRSESSAELLASRS